MKDKRIVFLGTPDFAVASLEALLKGGFNVVGVVTMPDKPAGRGHKLQPSPVKSYALEHDLPLLQPENLKDPEFLESLQAWQADIQVVVAFRMLPESVWNMPPMGTINVHGSLLPDYRGAAPIHHAVINGETETGVTSFQLKHEIDTGSILKQAKTAISDADTTGTVYERLMLLGAELLTDTLHGLFEGSITPIPQSELKPESEIKHAPKVFKEDGKLDFSQSARAVFNRIRGMQPFPGAFTTLLVDGKPVPLKVKAARLTQEASSKPWGSLETNGKQLFVHCADDVLELTQIQPPGKKAMDAGAWLNGLPKGVVLRLEEEGAQS